MDENLFVNGNQKGTVNFFTVPDGLVYIDILIFCHGEDVLYDLIADQAGTA